MTELADKECVPCKGGVPPLSRARIEPLRVETPEWQVIDDHHLRRELDFPDFRTALELVIEVGELAEEQGHHPDIHLSWGEVVIDIWTHKIDGLSESDFVLAAKIDRLLDDVNG